MKRDNAFIKNLLDTILPKTCIGCNKKGAFLCEDCFSLIEVNPYRYCFCHLPKKLSGRQDICPECRNDFLDRIYSASYYKDQIIKRLVFETKYHFQIKELCLPLSALILTHLKIIDFQFDASMTLIPIPLHKSRERWRGFNQSKEIVKIINNELSIPCSLDNLIKIKNDDGLKDQTRYRIQRPEEIKDKTILLIDDTYTTGSKMKECAKILKQNGARYVYAITAAREILT